MVYRLVYLIFSVVCVMGGEENFSHTLHLPSLLWSTSLDLEPQPCETKFSYNMTQMIKSGESKFSHKNILCYLLQ